MNKTYYDILGVSSNASPDEITAAKTALAKKYHPDANMMKGIDTTEQMQEILEAYRILSDSDSRADYDREIKGNTSVMQTFDLHETDDSADESTHIFVTYWKTANALYDIILKSDALFKQKAKTGQLKMLASKAIRHIIVLKDAQIPERYWHPDIMNWLLFASYKNRNYSTAYLLTLYDEHVKNDNSRLDRLKLKNQAIHYQRSLKKLVKY